MGDTINIKIISQYYYPDNFLVNDISRELVKRQHAISVLTGLPDYSTTRVPKEYRFFRKRKENFGGVKIRRVPIIARRTGVLFRILNYISFVLFGSLYAVFSSKKKIDAIISYQTSPIFQSIPGIIFKKRTKKPFVIYCCDLWPESLKAWGVPEKSLMFKIVKSISSWIYRQADIVAITSEPFREYLISVCNVEKERIQYLPQHANDTYQKIVGKYIENDCIDFLFAGNLGAVQDVDKILKAVKEINTEQNFLVHIVGDGSEFENLKLLASELQIEELVVFHGRFPSNEMERFYSLADCFLLTLRGDDYIGKTLPAKAQGYLSVGKPVVGAIDGAGYDLIIKSGCGEVVAAGDIEGLAKKMTIVMENFSVYAEKGCRGREYFLQNFTIDRYIENILNIIRGALEDGEFQK